MRVYNPQEVEALNHLLGGVNTFKLGTVLHEMQKKIEELEREIETLKGA